MALTSLASVMVLGVVDASAQQLGAPSAEGAPGNDLSFSLTGAVSQSDNIRRVSTGEEDGTIGQAGLMLGYTHNSRRLAADLDANVVYEHYFDDTFDDDVVGGFAGVLNIGIVPERFEWIVEENFGQIRTDPFEAITADNRQHLNYFTTGPDLTLRMGSVTSLRLSGRYSDTQYETTDADGTRLGGSVALIRSLSNSSTLSLIGTGERFEFENEVINPEYDRYQAFLRYDARGARTELMLDLGYTTIDRNHETSDGLLARLSLSRALSRASRLSITAGTQFSDSGDLFRDTQERQGVGLSTHSAIGTTAPFESRFGSLGWEYRFNRTSLGLDVGYAEERYEGEPAQDRNLTTYDAYAGRQLSPTLDLQIYARMERERYENIAFDDEELQVGVALGARLGRTFKLRLQVDWFDRDSSVAAVGYEETRITAALIWSPTGRSPADF